MGKRRRLCDVTVTAKGDGFQLQGFPTEDNILGEFNGTYYKECTDDRSFCNFKEYYRRRDVPDGRKVYIVPPTGIEDHEIPVWQAYQQWTDSKNVLQHELCYYGGLNDDKSLERILPAGTWEKYASTIDGKWTRHPEAQLLLKQGFVQLQETQLKKENIDFAHVTETDDIAERLRLLRAVAEINALESQLKTKNLAFAHVTETDDITERVRLLKDIADSHTLEAELKDRFSDIDYAFITEKAGHGKRASRLRDLINCLELEKQLENTCSKCRRCSGLSETDKADHKMFCRGTSLMRIDFTKIDKYDMKTDLNERHNYLRKTMQEAMDESSDDNMRRRNGRHR